VPDHHQLTLDDDRLRHVEALVCLARGEVDRLQHARRSSSPGFDSPRGHCRNRGISAGF